MHHLKTIEKYGQEQFDKWHRGFFNKPPKGESFSDVEKRVKPFVDYLIKFVKKNKVNLLTYAIKNLSAYA